MHVHVGGDGSHLALVDTRQYQSFVGRDWADGERLYEHLVHQAGLGHILAWRAGFESDWLVEVRAGHSTDSGFRSFVADIFNTGDSLHLVNYDSLTMAAQFDDHVLPDAETTHYQVSIPPGAQRVRVVQLFDPKSKWWETLGDSPAFRIEHEPSLAQNSKEVGVHWWQL